MCGPGAAAIYSTNPVTALDLPTGALLICTWMAAATDFVALEDPAWEVGRLVHVAQVAVVLDQLVDVRVSGGVVHPAAAGHDAT